MFLSQAKTKNKYNVSVIYWDWQFRTYYLKIWHLGVLNILSWRNLRNSRCREDFWPSPEVGIKTLKWETLFVHAEERNIPTSKKEGRQQKSEWTSLAMSPLVYYTELILIPTSVRSHLPTTFHSDRRSHRNAQTFSGLHFLVKEMSCTIYMKWICRLFSC